MLGRVFKGVKIADFTWVGVGPTTIKFLADHGAEVIHIESATHPDLLRTTPPFKDKKPGINRSAYQACFNNNKYGLSLNLNHPGAKKVLSRLIEWADIVAESFSPGTMNKWGLAYEDLVKFKPDIIMYSTSQQGQTGPHAKIEAYGTQLVSLSGFTHLTGWPDRDPTGPYGPYTDTISPNFGAVAIISALIHRRRTGKGTHIDLSQLEAGVNFLAPLLLDYTINHRIAQRKGNRCSFACPHGVYPCRGDDRWCAITIFNDGEYRKLCQIMNKPELSFDPRFATLLQRKRNEDELDHIVSQWTIKLTAERAMHLLQKEGLAAGVAQTAKDLLEFDPQLAHRHFFCELTHAEIGKHHYEAPPFKLSKTPCELHMPGPCVGEHNEIVCTKILGFSDKEFIQLIEEGVLE
jgi:benzylsuccinate CoA-transferase BbsF subunit